MTRSFATVALIALAALSPSRKTLSSAPVVLLSVGSMTVFQVLDLASHLTQLLSGFGFQVGNSCSGVSLSWLLVTPFQDTWPLSLTRLVSGVCTVTSNANSKSWSSGRLPPFHVAVSTLPDGVAPLALLDV